MTRWSQRPAGILLSKVMRYTKLEVPEKHNGGNVFLHCVELTVRPSRKQELINLLEQAFGKKHSKWRIRFSGYKWQWSTRWTTVSIRFKNQNDAIRFKLSWQPDDAPSVTPWLELYKGFGKGELVIFGSGVGIGKAHFK